MITKNKFDDIIFLALTDSKTFISISIESYSLEIFISFLLSNIFYLMIDAMTKYSLPDSIADIGNWFMSNSELKDIKFFIIYSFSIWIFTNNS